MDSVVLQIVLLSLDFIEKTYNCILINTNKEKLKIHFSSEVSNGNISLIS